LPAVHVAVICIVRAPPPGGLILVNACLAGGHKVASSVERRASCGSIGRNCVLESWVASPVGGWEAPQAGRTTMLFRNRQDAAEKLAQALIRWKGKHPLVYAIPRGAVPMGRIIADRLDGELDVVLTRKLHAPGNPEFAVGAVDESGWVYLADYAANAGATPDYVQRQVAAETATIRARRAQYTPGRAPPDPQGRLVIVVDDGLATGATMVAALHALRARNPQELVCAVPVASVEALALVRGYADDVVCLEAPAGFYAVGQFYLDFRQVDDSEVIALLRSP
jgi:putative phosphoribosyl transferase